MEKGKTKTSKDKHFKNRGFTLFELMIVLLLLGFISLLTFPNFRALLEPRDVKRAVLSLVGTLRYAQSQTATTKQKYRLVMDLKENAFWVDREVEDGSFQRDPSSMGKPAYLPAGVTFIDATHPERGKVREGAAQIEFSPTGWAEEWTLHVQRGEQEVYTIFIHPLGGKIEAVSGYVERWKG